MLFNSWTYFVFILVGITLSYLLKGRTRLVMLLIFNLSFYAMWRLDFTFLMLFSASVDFFTARKIDKEKEKSRRLPWLILTLVVNLGLLVFFKYAYFVDDNINGFFGLMNWEYHGLHELPFRIVLPLGISFYTFHTISYTIDVYRGLQKSTSDFILFSTFVTFWPQLIAGPILRVGEVVPQLKEEKKLSYANLNSGFYRVLAGLVKKVFLADNIATLVNEGFLLNTDLMSAWDVWTLTILFGFQIYFDFSGYSDIAIGTARMMGFSFPENFDWPYLAKSPREFWKRWHISLSSWIRDYLYLPLMGVKFKSKSTGGLDIQQSTNDEKENQRPIFALFATWIIMGFWHGAGWNFAIWGFYHAVMIFLFRQFNFFQRMAERNPLISWCITFFLMMASWIPFRSQTVDQTFTLFSTILNPLKYSWQSHQLHISYYFYSLAITACMVLMYGGNELAYLKRYLELTRYAAIPVLVFLIIVYLQQVVQFIYFQF